MNKELDTGARELDDLKNLLIEVLSAEKNSRYDDVLRSAEQVLADLNRVDIETDSFVDIAHIKASALRALGDVAERQSQYQLAFEYNQSALNLSQDNSDLPGMSAALRNCGVARYYLSDFSSALSFLMKALNITEELGDKRSIARCCYNIGLVYSNIPDIPMALEYYSKALAIREELGEKQEIGACYGSMGNVYSYAQDYQKALEYHTKALSIDEEIGNHSGVAKDLGNIGNIYTNLSEFKRALEWYSRTLTMYEGLNHREHVSNTLNNMGIAYVSLGDYTSALDCYSKALSIDNQIGRRLGTARNLTGIGEVYFQLLDYDKANDCFNQALDLASELGLKSLSGYIKAEMAKLYCASDYASRDEQKAESLYLESIATSEQLGVEGYASHRSLAVLYELQGRWQEAYTHLTKYLFLKDKAQIDEAKNRARQLEQQRLISDREREFAVAVAANTAEVNATKNLLHKVLPPSVASRLLEGESEIADYFTSVSVLFADIAGFTPISAGMPAYMVVRFLNYVFGEFDAIIKKHGCEKIKTIGDGYMAVAGAPLECADHAERITAAALEMQEVIVLPDEIREYLPEGASFGVRVGLHTGSVVAGVIGTERFVYDIYSDAVNIAARMESHGVPDKIHVTQDFVRHLQNRFAMTKNSSHGLVFEKRGEIEIKGKGIMQTYFLERA